MQLRAGIPGGRLVGGRDEQSIRKTFPTLAAAKAWRADAQAALHRGTLRAPSPVTVKQAAEAWLAGAQDGTVCNRSGSPYKPSAIRTWATRTSRSRSTATGT